ncbi:Eco57I restriction-modification methylase domain-containing protein [Nitrospira sp. CMX1]
MKALASELRKQLGKTVLQAREVAEIGARKALEALAVHEPDPYKHLSEEQRLLRRALRAQARQLGDEESRTKKGAYEITHLKEKVAYDQWHRLLFARFLIENSLLISPEHGVAVSFHDCEELAPALGLHDGWAVAAKFAAAELPEIFREDDPTGRLDLPVEDRNPLIQLVTGLPAKVFLADDSLGWVYQFWQAKRKDEVNESGAKIGADELSPVTQLFTEDYMVLFLLHNTLGAWWAGKLALGDPSKFKVGTEEEARKVAALPSVEWTYLRFIKNEAGEWQPAAGTFDSWTKTANEIRVLDPCMGSGHFLVAELPILVAMRMAEEGLVIQDAVLAVLRDNLYGLELDFRCTQIAAFNLAMAAWKLAGYQQLPPLNLACSGLAPRTKLETWTKLANGNERLREGMERLYQIFKDGPTLGSLINPRKFGGDLLTAEFHELQPLVQKALEREGERGDEIGHELAVTAKGLAQAAEILAGQFTLVVTNVPYLGRGKQDDALKDYCKSVHPLAKADLATCFVERCVEFCRSGGSTALVTPQNWLFLGSYESLRSDLFRRTSWNLVAKLGPAAFEDMNWWAANTVLFVLSQGVPNTSQTIGGLDVSGPRDPQTKAVLLHTLPTTSVNQLAQLNNPDARLLLSSLPDLPLMQDYAEALQGISPADFPHFGRLFWELHIFTEWRFWQSTIEETIPYGGRELLLWWNDDLLSAIEQGNAFLRGERAWGRTGVVVRQMRHLPSTLYMGEPFDTNCAVILPRDPSLVPAIWTFCSSNDFLQAVRQIDQKTNVTNATLVKVPFDLTRWQREAAEKYPNGLPKPFSSDPTQWLFSGDPKGSDHPLQAAVARLLGYRWPRQTGSNFPDCPALGEDGLEKFVDSDGIVCISAIKGEEPAAERLRALLAAAYGSEWTAAKQAELLAQVDHAGKSLEDWIRNGFFEQHCALFHHRPFIWHIWDGQKAGFSALVNYHQLTKGNLEKLTYSYLGDWISRQKAAVSAGDAGSDARLQAAKELQGELQKILEGEPPYDIFVRWKPIEKQSVGWDPDLNDGVRLNIRPFMSAKDVGKKGAGILRAKPNIKWSKDRGTDVDSAPWFKVFKGERINDHHLTLDEKRKAQQSSGERRSARKS